MIRLGVCAKPEHMELLAKQGFEYIEIGLSWLHSLSEEDYQKELAIAKAAPINVEAANGMLPGTVKVTGPDADEATIRAYLEKAFSRAHEIGIKVIVFGSGAARGVPEGWPHAEAWRQIARYLTIAEEYCAKYDIEIAIEPLRRAECNIMNMVTEGTMMSALLNLPHIGTLGDTYHMVCSHEPYSAFVQAGKLLKHVHIGHTIGVDQGRIWPTAEDGENYREVFEALEAAGYKGRVSIEAGTKDMAADGPKAFAVLDKARKG
ncbi:MAG: sugar phosphate isomerase/epimerase [Clostridia bacterium]|nr:sugar phosphate isomerase/epimerase [Clostridia bacterium]MBR4728571.1 sugar phosphate isomerase/epimerase [Clostridia bacterium]